MTTKAQLQAIEQCKLVNTKTVVGEDGQSKTCTKCGEMQSQDEFHALKRGILGKNAWCKKCMKTAKAKWDADNWERKKETQRIYYEENRELLIEKAGIYRIKTYGLSVEQYFEMAKNGCWICGSFENLGIDHDHSCCPEPLRSCGKCVRGILCRGHNQALGQFADDPILLIKAANYLLQIREE